MLRNGTKYIYDFIYLLKDYFHKASHWMEASWSFHLPSKSGSALFKTHSEHIWAATSNSSLRWKASGVAQTTSCEYYQLTRIYTNI